MKTSFLASLSGQCISGHLQAWVALSRLWKTTVPRVASKVESVGKVNINRLCQNGFEVSKIEFKDICTARKNKEELSCAVKHSDSDTLEVISASTKSRNLPNKK